jgi:miniconductance mechanosensitive channel
MIVLDIFGISEFFSKTLQKAGFSELFIYNTNAFVFILILTLLCFIVNWIAKNVILVFVRKLIGKTPGIWNKNLLEKKLFLKLSHLAPVFVIYLLGPAFMSEYPVVVDKTYLFTSIYIVIVILLVLYSFLNVINGVYSSYEISRSRPIKGYLQGLKIVIGIISAILIFSFLLDKSPIYLLTGLGAATAILMLIFKDTIMNFVGGVQVTANDLVQIGDWIEMPKYGADGDVIDISLNTVKIQNFDRTITTIPTYALVSDSFKNWRGMVQTGGRRIMRSVTIDLKSIKFCDDEMIKKFEGINYLQEYIKTKKVEIENYNKKNNIDNASLVNGRRLTNIGTFRAYIENYLANHPSIHKDLIFMVRQLQADEKGVPLQIYAFTNDVAWKNFEKIQSDIFDHIFAVIPFFDLRVFQYPTDLSMHVDINKNLDAK